MGVLKYFPGLSTTPASTTTTSTITATITTSQEEFPQWVVWLIVALVGLGVAAAFASKQ